MEEFFSALVVFGFSTVKFLTGVASSLAFQQGLLPSYISTVGGGIVGVFIFTFFGEFINKIYRRLFPKRKVKRFSKWNRFIVKIRRSFGIPGIAMLTPFLSVPVGIFLSLSMSKNKWRISFFMFLSFVIWSTIIFVPYYIFDFNISAFFASLF